MSRPIAYNTSFPLSGSITTQQGGGLISYTIDGTGRDYSSFAGKKWVPSADGAGPIIFVTDSATQGIHTAANAVPLFYVCNGTSSAAIVYTANHLPGSPGNYTTAEDAITDLLSNDWFIIEREQPFEGTTADQMLLDLDASKYISYPKTQTAWYDISGNNNGGTLTNGPAFNSGGWFNFDGTNDYCTTSVTRGELKPYGSYEAIFRYDGSVGATYQALIGGNSSDFFIGKNNGNNDLGIQDGGYNPSVGGGYDVFDGKWHHLVYTYDNGSGAVWLDGVLRDNPSFGGASDARIHYIGLEQDGGGFRWTGDISKVRFYTKVLDEGGVLQNYYNSNIVTNGLVFSTDPNNIVSYPQTGVVSANLINKSDLGTLLNGASFVKDNGGAFLCDGVNDYLMQDTNNSACNPGLTNDFTVEGWSRPTFPTSSTLYGVAGKMDNVRNGWMIGWNNGTAYATFRNASSSYSDATMDVGTSVVADNNWHHMVATLNRDVGMKLYVDGKLEGTTNSLKTLNHDLNSTSRLTIGRFSQAGGYFMDGEVGPVRVYNRELSAQEVLQNYQAEQYRFLDPPGFTTDGLVLYWDAGNQDSYPGTGAYIYDLSGNGNNGSLVNGVSFNTANGGVLEFDGLDDYVYSASPDLRTTDCTVIGISRYVDFKPSGTYLGGRIINAYYNNWLMGHWSRSAQKYYAQGWVTDSDGTEGYPDTNWHFYHTYNNYSADQWSFYIDNALDTGPSNAGSEGPNGFTVGRYMGNSTEYSISNFAVLLAYDRILDAAEVTQIYNYFRGRFNV